MRCWMVSGQVDLSLAGEGSKCLECRQEVDEAAAEADECEDMENVSARECFEAGMLLELGALRMLEEKGGKWEEVYAHRSGRLHFCFKEIFEDMEDARQRYSDAALDYGHAPSQVSQYGDCTEAAEAAEANTTARHHPSYDQSHNHYRHHHHDHHHHHHHHYHHPP